VNLIVFALFQQQTDKFWVEFRQNTYLFERAQLLVEKLKSPSVTVATILQFFDQYLSSESLGRSKFSSQFFGKDCEYPPTKAIVEPEHVVKTKKTVVINEPSLFKRSMPLLTVQSYEVN
jgi:secreted Zn-dependent insulinase-like peptidase